MHDPTTDEKIQQLVQAVLQAVDTRLDGIRHEMAQFGDDVERRHHEVLTTIAALEQRIDAMAAAPTATTTGAPAAGMGDRMEQATKLLIERIETAQRASMAATNQRLTQLDERIEALRPTATPRPATTEPTSGTPATAAPTAPPVQAVPAAWTERAEPITGSLPHLTNAELDRISKPLITYGHITSQVPIVPDHHGLRQMTAAPMPPLVTPTVGDGSAPTIIPAAAPAAPVGGDDEIDINRLASLLSEKLGQFSLPNGTDPGAR